MVTPLVSIVIPIYNTEKFLTECLDSIYTQTYKYLEIILINDGSTDKSPAIIDKHAKTDKRVKVIHKQNEGVSATKNLGLRKASGKFIAFIDSDDYIRNDFIENLMNAMIKFDSLIASTPTVSQHNLTNKMDTKIIEAFDHYESFERLFYGTLENSDNGIQMFDRQLLVDNFVQFDQAKKIGEDFDFFAQALVHTNKVVVDYRKMYYYRSNPDSVMHQHVNKELMKAVTNFASIGDKLINTYPELLPAVNAKKFSDSISLSIKSYSTRDDWKDDRTLLEKNIKNLRWKVPFNPKIKARVRLAGVIYCLLGYNAGTFILRSIKR